MTQELHIKNMVCDRCKLKVSEIFLAEGIETVKVDLGLVKLKHDISEAQKIALGASLHVAGFELLDDKKDKIVNQIKAALVDLVHYTTEKRKMNLSDFLSDKLHYDYNYLSNIFSKEEGITIEKYYILQKMEKVKEMIEDDEKTLSMIADELDYSSVAYLSNQFKKETGLSPTQYKATVKGKRESLDKL